MPDDHADRRALLAARLRRAAEGGGELRRAPLSLAQQRLWFVEQMAPGGSAYTISSALRLEGALDVPRLSAALTRIRARHPSLRTRSGCTHRVGDGVEGQNRSQWAFNVTAQIA